MTDSQKNMYILNIQTDKASAKKCLYQEIENIRSSNPGFKIDAIVNEDNAILTKITVTYGWLWNGITRENYGVIEIVPIKPSFAIKSEPKKDTSAPESVYNQMLKELSLKIKHIKIDEPREEAWTVR
jgi:hypothetical protein